MSSSSSVPPASRSRRMFLVLYIFRHVRESLRPPAPLYDHETDPQICEKDHMKETDRYESQKYKERNE